MEKQEANHSTKYYSCVGWHDGKRVSRCVNAPCISTEGLGFKCKAGLDACGMGPRKYCRRVLEPWDLLELKYCAAVVPRGEFKIGVDCKVCGKQNLALGDMVSVNDAFFICRECLDERWNAVLEILFPKD